ncbi:MAG: putative rane protein [Deltaproteobacteria bacterium]|nr:putative rane protein [Deltaproteobacteria bacterium]
MSGRPRWVARRASLSGIVRAMRRWQRYWFRAGGPISSAILRIAIATSILWMLWRLRDGYAGSPDTSPHGLYRPIGILRLVPGEPSPMAFSVVWAVAWAATVAMLLGLRSRTSTAVSFVAALVIASYEYSFAASWSHDNNAPLLAQLAFLGARGGDAWSIDAWWRRRRGDAAPAGHAYAWSVLLVQLAIGLMMASAAYTKLASGGTSLAWVCSDNLRNHILVRFDLAGLPRTAIADWLVDSPVRWKVTAALNIVAQLAPLAACFATRRPVLRALLGSMFVIETFALDAVMGFSNYHWLPLGVVFVDWDWLAARLQRRAPEPDRVVSVRRIVRGFVAAFVLCDLVIAFYRWPKLDQRLGAYPLSAFPMFGSIRARPPYGEHQLYEILEGRIEVVSDPRPEPAVQSWIDHHPAGHDLLGARTADEARATLTAFSRELQTVFPNLAIRTLRAQLVSIQAQPYPAPARLDRVDVATIAELSRHGSFRCMLGQVDADRAFAAPVGLPASDRLASYRDGGFTDLVVGGAGLARKTYVVVRVVVPGEGERTFVVGARS